MAGSAAPIHSLLLHGSVISDADAGEYRGILKVLRSMEGLTVAFTPEFHAVALPHGLSSSDDTISDADGFSCESEAMVLTFGGDGTVLETAAMLAGRPVPVLGINTGRLGFLSHLPMPDAAEALPEILMGGYKVERRAMLEVDFPGQDLGSNLLALNEITVHRRDVASMIRVSVSRNGVFINRYWSDGLIKS